MNYSAFRSKSQERQWVAKALAERMFTALVLVPLGVEAVCGAAGGIATGFWLRERRHSVITNAIIGAVGGLLFTWLAARVPGISSFVTVVETTVDGVSRSTGGITLSLLVGVGIAGLIGGIVTMFVVGLAGRR